MMNMKWRVGGLTITSGILGGCAGIDIVHYFHLPLLFGGIVAFLVAYFQMSFFLSILEKNAEVKQCVKE